MTTGIEGEIPPEPTDLALIAQSYDQLVIARSEHSNWLHRFGQLPTNITLNNVEYSTNDYMQTMRDSFSTILSTTQPSHEKAAMIAGVIESDFYKRQMDYGVILKETEEEVVTYEDREEFIYIIEDAINRVEDDADSLIDCLMEDIIDHVTGNLGSILEELNSTPRARLVKAASKAGKATLKWVGTATATASGIWLYNRFSNRR